jgi:hypothetical protein
MSEYLMEMVGYQVQGTAEWRREKARQFPGDQRNLIAAEELDELAAQIERVGGSEQIHKQIVEILDSFRRLDDDRSLRAWEDINETVSVELRSVGFHGGYTTATKFLEWYRDFLQEELHEQLDEVIPPADLEEQVENDPAVKAAKQAYDEARARAYAEARKKL